MSLRAELPAKIQHLRTGQEGAPDVLVKTHYWSNNWDPSAYGNARIYVTHRDLQGVVASYQRVGWAFDIPDSYVNDHQRWKVVHLPLSLALIPSALC